MNISPNTSNPVYLNVPSNMHGIVISNQSDVAVVLQTNYHEFTIPEFCAYTNECAPGDQLEFIANANATTGMVEVNFYEAHLQTSLVPTRSVIQSNVNALTVSSGKNPPNSTILLNASYYVDSSGPTILPVLDLQYYKAISITTSIAYYDYDISLSWTQTSNTSFNPYLFDLTVSQYNQAAFIIPVIYPFLLIAIYSMGSQTIPNICISGLTDTDLNPNKIYTPPLYIYTGVGLSANSTYQYNVPNYIGPATLTANFPIQPTPQSLEIKLVIGNYQGITPVALADFIITGSSTAPTCVNIDVNIPTALCQLVIINSNSVGVVVYYSLVSN